MNRQLHSGWLRGVTVLLLTALLGACGGGGGSGGDTAGNDNAAPTRTPRPTREAATEPETEPTRAAAPTRVTRPTATTAVDEEPTPESSVATVLVGELVTYEHDSGAFSIDVPDNWAMTDNSSDSELIIYWTDPTKNGALQINIFLSSDQVGSAVLIDTLQKFLEDSFGVNNNFGMDEPIEQNDGSQLITWTFDTEVGNVTATMLGNSFIEQRGTVVSILTTLVPQDQFDYLIPHTNAIINSYRIDTETTDLGAGGSSGGGGGGGSIVTTASIGELVPIDHPSGTFETLVPDNWDFVDQSTADELLLLWLDPSETAAEIIDIIEEPVAYSNSRLEAHQLAHLEALFGTQPAFTVDSAEEQADGSLRVYLEFEDTDAAGQDVAIYGYSYVEQRGDIIAILTVLLPSTADDALIAGVGEILGGYRVNAAGSLD